MVEPMCGSLAATLHIMPERALLNDINPHLINLYRWISKGLEIGIEMENDEHAYYGARDQFNQLIALGRQNTGEAAQLFYYLNRTCYNGLCRFNSKGLFNVPFGRYHKINYAEDFKPYRETFSKWEFSNKSYRYLEIMPDDFVYLDPPYDVDFTNYSGSGFGWRDQERLAGWASDLETPVVISNQATERIIELYNSLDFNLKFEMAPRAISCTGDRSKAREVIASKNIAPVR